MSKFENHEKMVGTKGGADYLVIAKSNGLSLGIKPLMEGSHNYTSIAYRARVANVDGSPVEGGEAAIKEAFPKLQFGKIDGKRGSFVRAVMFGCPVYAADKVKKIVANMRLRSKFLEQIANMVSNDEQFCATADDTWDFMQEAIDEMLGKYDGESVSIDDIPLSMDFQDPHAAYSAFATAKATAHDKAKNKGFKVHDGEAENHPAENYDDGYTGAPKTTGFKPEVHQGGKTDDQPF